MTSNATPGSESRTSAAGSPSARSPNSARNGGLPWTIMWPGPWSSATGCAPADPDPESAGRALGTATVGGDRRSEGDAHPRAHREPVRDVPERDPERRADSGADRDPEADA